MRRILVIDDDPEFHEEIRAVLCRSELPPPHLRGFTNDLFGNDPAIEQIQVTTIVDTALSGEDGAEKIRLSMERQQPYMMTFVEMRMQHGLDGLETLQQIWRLSPDMQVVLCTADPNFPWAGIQASLPQSKHALILKKPIDMVEVQQLVEAMANRWRRIQRRVDVHDKAYQTHFEYLTGLPNRGMLLANLEQDLDDCEQTGRCSALMLIDLNDFKKFNEIFGQARGNLLLQEVANLLPGWIRPQDMVAHLGADIFAVVLHQFESSIQEAGTSATQRAKTILKLLTARTMWANVSCSISASIGLTLFGDQAMRPDDVLMQCEFALREAKEVGNKTVRMFDPNHQAAMAENVWLCNVLRGAVEHHELELHYQGQLNQQHQLIGCEALLRWDCPGRGPIPPAVFIPLAEQTGLIVEIGNWVLEMACRTLAQWAKQPHMAQLIMAINISAEQIQMPDFVELVLAALARHGVAPERLYLELTESQLVSDLANITDKMQRLKAHGIRIALDDFGTGYSSLTYLKHLPFNQIKIDRSFVAEVLTDKSAAIIARSIIALTQSLGLSVVAEGVETKAQLDFLTDNGCDEFQGYLFCKPVPETHFNDFVMTWKPENALAA